MSVRSAGKPAARRLSSDERRVEIVQAVLGLAGERGPDAITTQAIAERIGVTQGALFRHFPDKDAMWVAVFEWVRRALAAREPGARVCRTCRPGGRTSRCAACAVSPTADRQFTGARSGARHGPG